MSEDATIVDQLQSINERIRQERASLSVLGRPLTPDEETRVSALSSAESYVESAINALRSPQSAG